jgi:hypothetical protein
VKPDTNRSLLLPSDFPIGSYLVFDLKKISLHTALHPLLSFRVKLIEQVYPLTFLRIHISLQVQVECSLYKILGTRSVSDFRVFQILEYLHKLYDILLALLIQNPGIENAPKSKNLSIMLAL